MAKNQGTLVVDTIRPYDSQDSYPTHEDQYGKVGFRVVDTIDQRNAISAERRLPGMIVAVRESNIVYQLNDDMTTWGFAPISQNGPNDAFTSLAQGLAETSAGALFEVFENGLRKVYENDGAQGALLFTYTDQADLAGAIADAVASTASDSASASASATRAESAALTAGLSGFFDDKDALNSAASGLADGRYRVDADETNGGLPADYDVASGAVVEPAARVYVPEAITPEHFGAVAIEDGGNTDQAAAITAWAAALQAGQAGTTNGKTYLVETNAGDVLLLQAAVQLGGATLAIDHRAQSGGGNDGVLITPTLDVAINWTESITGPTRTLTIANSGLVAGDYVHVQLGEHPNDPNEVHYRANARVTAADVATVTLDRIIPYTINDTAHQLNKIAAATDDMQLPPMVLDARASAVTPNLGLAIDRSVGVTVPSVHARGYSIAAGIRRGSSGVHIGRIVSEPEPGVGFGRAFTSFGARDCSVGAIQAKAVNADEGVVFIETSTQGLRIGQLDIDDVHGNREPAVALVSCLGASTDNRIETVNVRSLQPGGTSTAGTFLRLDRRNQGGEISFGTVRSNVTLQNLDLRFVDVLQVPETGTAVRKKTMRWAWNAVTADSANVSPDEGGFIHGYLAGVRVYVNDVTGLDQLRFSHWAAGEAPILRLNVDVADLVAGQWVGLAEAGLQQTYPQSSNQVNLTWKPNKSLALNTNANAAANPVTVFVEADYFPTPLVL